jgi:hypothetical protein
MPSGQMNENVFERGGMRAKLGKRDTLTAKFVKESRDGLVQFRNLE